MDVLYEAKVRSLRRATGELFTLELDIRGTPLFGAHRHPGQYVGLALPGQGQNFFAIASAPDPRRTTLEFLVKRSPGLAEALSHLTAGDGVKIGTILGEGFPVEKARGKQVLLFATGSAISPVRSLVETLRRNRSDYQGITLYFGVRTPDAFVYSEELGHWELDGIKVVRTVSQPGNSGWQGLTGYVQSHVPPEPLNNAVVFLCGHQEMVKGVTNQLVRRGLPKQNIFSNI